jgi:prefoldin subunit 5
VRAVGAQSRVQQMRMRLQTKMPDIKKGLEMVTLLCDKQGSGEELKLDFELSDNLYAKAKVKDATAVNIWLGANVMLEYEINEVRFPPPC